jgi:ferredoxin
MVVAERKPLDEIREMIQGCRKILVLGCGTCTTVCMTGGEKEVSILATELRMLDKDLEVLEDTIERQCDREFIEEIEKKIAECDAVLSMACGAGVQLVAEMFEDKPVYPALNTKFIGVAEEQGRWSEVCTACGDCLLAETGGICPVTRCSKGLLNGPCGGSVDGKCEVDPENLDCAWQLIYDRLKRLGRLDTLEKIREPKDWSQARDGGPRKMVKEDVVL